MFYYLFGWLDRMDVPGTGVFQFISFRSAMAVIFSLIITMILGRTIINYLQLKQVGEVIRNLGLEGQMKKQGTPTMGGLIIIAAIVIPTLLCARLDNVYIILMLVSTLWLGFIGFIDDYIKVFKKNKEGLAGRFKIIGQVGIGLIVGIALYFSEGVKVKERVLIDINVPEGEEVYIDDAVTHLPKNYYWRDTKSLKTTIPFIKDNEFNYSSIIKFFGEDYEKWGWIIFIPVVIIIVTAVSNGANITDGLDGLATGTSAIIGATLGIFAYVSGNFFFADYLHLMFIPDSGELVVFISAFVGACVGFLWFNSYPAQVFMGDTGSLALGGIIAVFAIAIRKELLIPVLCGIFLIENLSVMIQVSYFKYTKKKFGEGRRVFLMAPLHHHFQKKGMHEAKIVSRFWIVGVFLAILTFVTLKLR
jgi:phospho-N-acetylmuramoyl-pentapeptide-transferase